MLVRVGGWMVGLLLATPAQAGVVDWGARLPDHRYMASHDPVTQRQALQGAAADARAGGDLQAWAAAVALQLSLTGDRGDASAAELARQLEQALSAQAAPLAPGAGRVLAQLGLAERYRSGNEQGRANALLDQAWRGAQALGQQELLAEVLVARAIQRRAEGDAAAAQLLAQQAREATRDPVLKHTIFIVVECGARILSLHDSLAAERLLAEVRDRQATVDAQDLPYMLLSYAHTQARILGRVGRPQEGLASLQATLELLSRVPRFEFLPYARMGASSLYRQLGDWRGCVEVLSGLAGRAYDDEIRLQALVSAVECRARAGMPGVREDLARLEVLSARVRSTPETMEGVLTAHAQALAALGEHAAAFERLSRARQATLDRMARANEQARQRVETAYRVAIKDRENAELKAREQLAEQRRLALWTALGVAVIVLAVVAALWRRQASQRRQLAVLAGELSALNASRTRLVAAACHDLRQPAHALGMLAEVAARQVQGEGARVVEAIRRSSLRLSDLLDALFDLSRLESDRYAPSIGTVALGELLGDLRSQFTVAALGKGLSLQIEDVQATVRSDAHLLRRMLMNLLSNAIKYTAAGNVQIQARRVGGDWVVGVKDTGPGIPPEQQAVAFSEYVRLDSSRGSDGLGIGLALVKRSADLLGHRLALDSTVGEGSCFTLWLQALDDAAPAGEVAQAPGGEGQLIGLVEDDEQIREAMQALLMLRGYRAHAAASHEALQQQLIEAGTPRPELLLSDFHLGASDALATVAALVGRGGPWEGVPAVLITGDLSAELQARCQALGITVAYKPLPAAKLAQLVDRLLARPAPTGLAAAPPHVIG